VYSPHCCDFDAYKHDVREEEEENVELFALVQIRVVTSRREHPQRAWHLGEKVEVRGELSVPPGGRRSL